MECCMYITAHGGYCVDMKVLCGWGDLISLINTKLPFILRGETMTCKEIKRIIIIVFIIMAGNKYINLLFSEERYNNHIQHNKLFEFGFHV